MADKFSVFTLGDLDLALSNLLEKRLPVLQQSKVGLIYEPMLRKKHKQLQSIPTELKGGLSVADRLGEADNKHDAYLDTLLGTTRTVLNDPDAPAALKLSAQNIIDSLSLKPSDKSEDYPTEASTAKKREAPISALESELKQFSLSGGRTLWDTAQSYLETGRLIDTLLEERAQLNTIPNAERGLLRDLRPSTIGLLNRFRVALSDELAALDEDGSAPSIDLDAGIFSYFDELHKNRRALIESQASTRAKAAVTAQAEDAAQARSRAATAQQDADELAKAAQAAQKRAQEAKEEADKKSS